MSAELKHQSKKQEITVTVTINVDHDITDQHRVNTITNSLIWVAARIRKGQDSGNIHDSGGGQPCGHFQITPQNSHLHEGSD